MRQARESIISGTFPEFVRKFFLGLYPKQDYPNWVVDALNSVGIHLTTAAMDTSV